LPWKKKINRLKAELSGVEKRLRLLDKKKLFRVLRVSPEIGITTYLDILAEIDGYKSTHAKTIYKFLIKHKKK
jgi:hypothetical protein